MGSSTAEKVLGGGVALRVNLSQPCHAAAAGKRQESFSDLPIGMEKITHGRSLSCST